MTKKEVIALIDKELDWCKENPEFNFTEEYKKGFIRGLKQVKLLVKDFGRY